MMSRFNQMLYATITRNWSAGKFESYSSALRELERTHPSLAAAFDTIDNKASGILTHVSMMIAGLGLIAPIVAKHLFAEGVVIFQIMIYLLIALGCLRCLSIFNSNELTGSEREVQDSVQREFIIRHAIYTVSNRISLWFTVFVFISLPILWLWTP